MESKNWFVHVEWVVVLVTLLGGFYTLDSKIERCTQAQSARTDKLYEMYVQATEKSDKQWKEGMDRWADLLQKISEKKG